jgi:hypothetical protein
MSKWFASAAWKQRSRVPRWSSEDGRGASRAGGAGDRRTHAPAVQLPLTERVRISGFCASWGLPQHLGIDDFEASYVDGE